MTVLSEEPISEDTEIAEIVREAIKGDYSMDSAMTSEEIDGPTLASLALAQGTDPEFFGIDAAGQAIDY